MDHEPSWSADGRFIAYTHESEHKEVWLLSLNTMTKEYVTDGSMPAWSPDSRTLAFVRDQNIHLFSFATHSDTAITLFRSCDYPSWAPDGQRLVCSCHSSRGEFSLLVLYPLTGMEYSIPRPATQPAWSPDGTELVVSEPTQNGTVLFRLSVSGPASEVRLTQNTYSNANPSWSPDGQQIAWDVQTSGRLNGIWVMERDGTHPRRLTGSKGADPFWSPDGSRIVYTGWNDTSSTTTLWWMRADGSDQQPLTLP